jgi:hypothetical protein
MILLLLLSFSIYAILASICVSLVLILIQDGSGDTVSGGGGNKRIGTPLTLDSKTLEKRKGVWNTVHINNKHRLSVDSNGILKLVYAKNSHAGSSGAAIKALPSGLPADDIEFGYDVFFPDSFEWKKGGKLPGVCLGKSHQACATGKDWRKGEGSVRVMWRSKSPDTAYAIGYIYLPIGGGPQASYQKQGEKYQEVTNAKGEAGHELWQDFTTFPLRKGWNTVWMRVKMNTPGISDGVFELDVNGTTRRVDDVQWRTGTDVKVNSINFVSFFGGGNASWNSPSHSTFTQYRNVYLRT